jgi:Cu(I)/Ag(I) efflux system membrane protein CusA/SilA
VILITYLDIAYESRRERGLLGGLSNIQEAVKEGANLRLRPVIMTAAAIIGGLLPMLWGHGAGASVMRRIAAPMIGGMVTTTILTLLVIPALYSLWKEYVLQRELRHGDAAAVASGD